MCGSKLSFSSLNDDSHSTISFDDWSTVNVMGKGDIKIRNKNGFIEAISNVLYIPDFKSNSNGKVFIKAPLISILASRTKDRNTSYAMLLRKQSPFSFLLMLLYFRTVNITVG